MQALPLREPPHPPGLQTPLVLRLAQYLRRFRAPPAGLFPQELTHQLPQLPERVVRPLATCLRLPLRFSPSYLVRRRADALGGPVTEGPRQRKVRKRLPIGSRNVLGAQSVAGQCAVEEG
jgi:hypothetical protein